MSATDSSPDSLLSRAITLQRTDRFSEAERVTRRVVEQWPEHARGHCTHGVSLFHLNRLEDAAAAFRQAIAIDDGYANALCNLGSALHRLEKYGEAENAYRRALKADPNYKLARTGLAATLQESRKRGVTIAKINITLSAGGKPQIKTVQATGSYEERRRAEAQDVIDAFRSASENAPEDGLAAAQLYFELRHACDWQEMPEAEARLDALTRAAVARDEAPGEHAFIHISRVEDTAQNLTVARLHARAVARRDARPFTHTHPDDNPRPIRLGYLSADFRDHAIGHLIAGLFDHHDRARFEVTAYSHGDDDESAFRQRVLDSADRFVDLREVSDEAAAQRIFDDKIDILVDLSGQIRGHRLEIMALRPAPIQVAYIGFPGSNGAEYIDYMFTDQTVTPTDRADDYSEAPAYLPHCYLITDDAQPIAETAPSRAENDLPPDSVVFCSFNQGFKITPDVFDAWCSVMRNVEDSVLWLLEKNPLAQYNLRREAEARGVASNRLIFARRIPKPEHMARTQLADLALDTGIYTGHVTTCDMLWAGVPVITRLGNHFASRVSASALRAAGLPELITDGWPEFIKLATRLSDDTDARSALRAKLAAARDTAPLFDTARSVRALEFGFIEMWRRHCSGEAPRPIDIPDGDGRAASLSRTPG